MAARVKHPVEIGDVDIGELVGRCEVGLRFLVTLETLGRIGLCIGLVGFGIEWRLPAGRARQRDVVAGILEHIIGRGKFLEPEPGLLPGIAKLIVAGENHEEFHARSTFFKRRSPVAVWPGFVRNTPASVRFRNAIFRLLGTVRETGFIHQDGSLRAVCSRTQVVLFNRH